VWCLCGAAAVALAVVGVAVVGGIVVLVVGVALAADVVAADVVASVAAAVVAVASVAGVVRARSRATKIQKSIPPKSLLYFIIVCEIITFQSRRRGYLCRGVFGVNEAWG